MTKELETLVALKYEIITDNPNTWHLYETYPEEVISKLICRYAEEIEHLADGDSLTMYLVALAKKYRDMVASGKDINGVGSRIYTTTLTRAFTTNKESRDKYLQWLKEELIAYEERQ